MQLSYPSNVGSVLELNQSSISCIFLIPEIIWIQHYNNIQHTEIIDYLRTNTAILTNDVKFCKQSLAY